MQFVEAFSARQLNRVKLLPLCLAPSIFCYAFKWSVLLAVLKLLLWFGLQPCACANVLISSSAYVLCCRSLPLWPGSFKRWAEIKKEYIYE